MRHEFVKYIPETLEEDMIYVSVEYKTVAHLCACGCGTEVIIPIGPTDWSITFDGTTITLSPSIGNWNYPCQSHYFIRKNKVVWADGMSKESIEMVKLKDQNSKFKYYGKEKSKVQQDTVEGKEAKWSFIKWLQGIVRRK